ncbi:hypothetical protein [Paraburkholderia terrae]
MRPDNHDVVAGFPRSGAPANVRDRLFDGDAASRIVSPPIDYQELLR